MKKIIWMTIFIMNLVPVVMAQEPPAEPVDANAPVAQEPSQEPPQAADQDAVPRWKSSLNGIEDTTRSLLSANRSLADESKSLKDQITALEADIAAQTQKNQAGAEALVNYRKEAANPSDLAELKAKLVAVDQELLQKKNEIAPFKDRIKNFDSVLDLRRLKIKEAELQKKAALLERKAYEDKLVGGLRQTVQDLKSKTAEKSGQEQYLREKLDKLSKENPSSLADIKQAERENFDLENKLKALNALKAELSGKITALTQQRSKQESDKMVQRYVQLDVQSKGLVDKIAALNVKKEELTKMVTATDMIVVNDAKETNELEAQNKRAQREIDNLRENIAVLDYKINALKRYQNRNRD